MALAGLSPALGWSSREGSTSGAIPGPCWRAQRWGCAGERGVSRGTVVAKGLLGLTVARGWVCAESHNSLSLSLAAWSLGVQEGT